MHAEARSDVLQSKAVEGGGEVTGYSEGARVFGAEHLDTLKRIGNLAVLYWKQGRLEETERLQAQVKETCLKVLGAEHSDTLLSMGNLWSIYSTQGQWKDAEELQVLVMNIYLRLVGAKHPS